MSYSVHLNFDEASTDRIRAIFARLAITGLAPYMRDSGNEPHISLAIFESCDQEKLHGILTEHSRLNAGFSIEFQSIGVFPGAMPVVYLAPIFSGVLRKFHASLHEKTSGAVRGGLETYMPDAWIPHCTVGFKFDQCDLGRVVAEVADMLPVFTARVTTLNLIEIPTALIESHQLSGP